MFGESKNLNHECAPIIPVEPVSDKDPIKIYGVDIKSILYLSEKLLKLFSPLISHWQEKERG
ncbi:MAG: hypothetical protein SPF22_07810 [Candidatus Onthovivens sp.]|nr:hypothetical protein [Candidatus Onthovivens sp.]